MSRKSAGDQMAEDLAGGCIIAIFLALWAAIAGLIVAIVKAVQVSPEDQLRKMEAQTGIWCPDCRAALPHLRQSPMRKQSRFAFTVAAA